MRCKRCGGLMMVEFCTEDEREEQLTGRGALRCINCGALVTIRMLRNLATWHAQPLTLAQVGSPRNHHAARAARTIVQDLRPA